MNELTELSEAAYQCVQDLKSEANGYAGTAPWWHGWALREAFEAGARWQREQPAGPIERDWDTPKEDEAWAEL